MRTILLTTECDNFEIASGNSDSECFDENDEIAKENVIKNPKLCEICVYNKKHSHHNYQSWIDYRNKIGIPRKR